MYVVNSLEAGRSALQLAQQMILSSGSATSSRSPLAGEPNPSSDLVGGNKTKLSEYAREMRKDPTPWERKLWNLLKGKRLARYKFRRQAPIDHYIVDFLNNEKRLIIELDGSQHVDSEYDQKRDTYLQAQGFQILRFWNNELDANPTGILERIFEVLEGTPYQNPQEGFGSPARGERERVALPMPIIELCSPPYAACHAGVNYYRKFLDQLCSEFPDQDFSFTLCCGDDAAIAHDALRMGFDAVVCDCSDGLFAQLQAAAETVGAAVLREFPEAVIPAQAGIHAEQCA